MSALLSIILIHSGAPGGVAFDEVAASASRGGCRIKPFQKDRCVLAEVHAGATVRHDLPMDGPLATDEMAVFVRPPLETI